MEETTKRKPNEKDQTLQKLRLLIMSGEPFSWADAEQDDSEAGGGGE